MPPKKPGLMVRVWARIVLTYGKIYSFVADTIWCVKKFCSNYARVLKPIWTGFEIRNLFTCIKLSLGALVLAYHLTRTEFTRMNNERVALISSNINMYMPQGFFQQAKAYIVR